MSKDNTGAVAAAAWQAVNNAKSSNTSGGKTTAAPGTYTPGNTAASRGNIANPTKGMSFKTRDVSGKLGTARQKLKSTFGDVQLGGKSDYKSLAAMNENAIPAFNTAVDKYENGIKDVINDF